VRRSKIIAVGFLALAASAAAAAPPAGTQTRRPPKASSATENRTLSSLGMRFCNRRPDPLDSSRMAGPGHHNGWRGAARDRDNAIQMNRRIGTLAALIFALTAFGGLPSGSAARTPTITHTLHVDITEWAVVPSQGLVSAGPLRVTVEDYGRLRHELDIIRTPAWGQELRTRNGRAVGENAAPPVVVAPGQTRSTNIYLAPGFYVLLDNIPGHYAVGGAVSIIVA